MKCLSATSRSFAAYDMRHKHILHLCKNEAFELCMPINNMATKSSPSYYLVWSYRNVPLGNLQITQVWTFVNIFDYNLHAWIEIELSLARTSHRSPSCQMMDKINTILQEQDTPAQTSGNSLDVKLYVEYCVWSIMLKTSFLIHEHLFDYF